ncbi:MAG: putative viral replication protein [Cressdnaviricota sp.]|nr:MAG: putative viral replication protein [Cressdnaviricota sp.]
MSAKPTKLRGRSWCFTTNNPVGVDNPRCSEIVKYIVWQLEKGENGTEHLQGYLQLDQVRTFSVVKNISWLMRSHLEKAKGSLLQNKTYCSKEAGRLAGPWELGEPTQQGARSDVASYAEQIRDLKRPFGEILLENPELSLKYPTGSTMLRSACYANIRGTGWVRPQILVYIGPTGCGKSARARLVDPNLYTLPVHDTGTPWCNGYDGQKTILLDDFYGGIKHSLALRLLDGYPLQMQTKGGFVTLNHEMIIITSNAPPEQWYKYSTQAPAFALLRRLYEFGNVLEYVGGELEWKSYPYTLPVEPEAIFSSN